MSTSIDLPAAHKFFSAHCFNGVWALLDKPSRTSWEDEQMIAAAFASLYHWMQRPDCTPENLSIGTWQVSRVCVVLNRPAEARRYADLCLKHSQGLSAFLLGFAHEAQARAAQAAGDTAGRDSHLALAQQFTTQVVDPNERDMLLGDLATIEPK